MSSTLKISLFAVLVAAASPVLGATVVVPVGSHDVYETPALEQAETPQSVLSLAGAENSQLCSPFFLSQLGNALRSEPAVASLPPSAFWADASDVYTVSRSVVAHGGIAANPVQAAASKFAGLNNVLAPMPMDPSNVLHVGTRSTLAGYRATRGTILAVSTRQVVTGTSGTSSSRRDWFSGSDLKLSGASFVHDPAAIERLNSNVASLAGGF